MVCDKCSRRRGHGSYIELGVGMAVFWGGSVGMAPSRRGKREARGIRYQFYVKALACPPTGSTSRRHVTAGGGSCGDVGMALSWSCNKQEAQGGLQQSSVEA